LYQVWPAVSLLGFMFSQAHKADKIISTLPPERIEKLIRNSAKWAALHYDDPHLLPAEEIDRKIDYAYAKEYYEHGDGWLQFTTIDKNIPEDFKDLDPIYVGIRYQQSVTIAYVGGMGHVGMSVVKQPSGNWALEKYDDEHHTIIKEMPVNP